MEFQADFDVYRKQQQTYNNNLTKAYALLWSKCAKGMQNKIESRQDYKSILDDPLKLLQAIKEHSLNYQENKYPMSILTESLKALLNTRQKEKSFRLSNQNQIYENDVCRTC